MQALDGKGLEGLKVLVVDDEPDVRLGIARLIEMLGAGVAQAASAEEALTMMEHGAPHLLVSDIQMKGLTGVDLMRRTLARNPSTAVILVTGYGTISQAVECLQEGAAHFLTKPFDNEELLDVVARCGRGILSRRASHPEPSPLDSEHSLIVTGSPRMKGVLDLVAKAAATRVAVLIRGESGTGKELVARAIHAQSAAASRPFLAVNCAALPDTLIESELFGYRKGAFTGAVRDHDGIFSQADGGVVFLDEVSSMSLAFQGKLLRVLQERVVRPLGTTSDVKVDFRLVVATNRDLRSMVERGEFREDLFYRFCVLIIEIPALRDRPGDVPLLARHFLEKAARECLADPSALPALSEAAQAEIESYDWPGNVRELENTMQRALIMCRSERIEPEHLLLYGGAPAAPGSGSGDDYESAKLKALERFQRCFVTRALARTGGNVSRAAAECGLTRTALQRIMKSLNLEKTDFR